MISDLFTFGIVDGCFLSSMLAWALVGGMVGYRWGWLGLVIGVATAVVAPAVSLLTLMVVGSVLRFFGRIESSESELIRTKEEAAHTNKDREDGDRNRER